MSVLWQHYGENLQRSPSTCFSSSVRYSSISKECSFMSNPIAHDDRKQILVSVVVGCFKQRVSFRWQSFIDQLIKVHLIASEQADDFRWIAFIFIILNVRDSIVTVTEKAISRWVESIRVGRISDVRAEIFALESAARSPFHVFAYRRPFDIAPDAWCPRILWNTSNVAFLSLQSWTKILSRDFQPD